MDFGLDEERGLIVATVRRLVEKELRAWSAPADRAGEPPERLLTLAGEIGFLLDAVPAEAGGLLEGDYSHLTRALRSLELGRGCAALAALLEGNVEPALAVGAWGSEEAKEALFGALAAGGLATTANDFEGRLEIAPGRGGGLTVTGALGPLPALAAAAHVLVSAPNPRSGEDPGQAALFLLPIEAGELEAMTPSGWRAARWGRLHLRGAEVPPALVLARGAGAGEKCEAVLSWCRLCLAARAVGVATAAMEHARGYGEERVQFGQPIGTFESLVRMQDENETAIAAARLLVLEAAWKIDRGRPEATDTASRARDLACRVLARAAIDAVQIYGGYGFVNDFPVEKLMRDARAFEVLLGNEALGRVLARRFAPATE